MRRKAKSFGWKLWTGFFLFAAIIFSALWLLQTVFLQSFYDRMIMGNVRRAADQIAETWEAGGTDGPGEELDALASDNSLLLFVTDWDGRILYSTDEHNSVYGKHGGDAGFGGGKSNPYRCGTEPMGWELGVYRNLPDQYEEFLDRLMESADGTVGYTVGDGSAYVYGKVLTAAGDGAADLNGQESTAARGGLADAGNEAADGQAVLYISAQLGAVGAAVGILRVQLVWVTAASLLIGALIAWLLSRQFSRPIRAISLQAKRMALGEFSGDYQKGFCQELDELSDTLSETSAALDRLEHARRDLMAGMSHDLRTPLTMIKGYAEMVRDFSWKDETAREEDLAVIIREADRLTDLVNDILEYTAVSETDFSEDMRPFDLGAAAAEVTESFARLCQERGCRLDVAADPGLMVTGSEERIKRVFYNLIDNAVTHSGDRPWVEVSVKREEDAVRAEIRDHGTGIPKEEIPYIWDRYFTSKERRKKGSRSGLGLAITKEILLAHGARFGVESEEGKGSVFWFEMAYSSPSNCIS